MKSSKKIPDIFVEEGHDVWMEEESIKETEIATMKDVMTFCCKRPFCSWMSMVLYFLSFVTLLYGFIFGITLLESSIEILSSCQLGPFIKGCTNPLSSFLVGMIATCICQSSLVVNSVIGSLVGNVLDVRQSIFLTMGANIGNTVTNNMLVFAHITNQSELERAAAGASVNDFFYFYAVLVFLPLEAISGALYHLSSTLVPTSLNEGYQWVGLIGQSIIPFTDQIIMTNKALMNNLVAGNISNCTSVYPVSCEDGNRSYETCTTGILGCNEDTGRCPFLFKETSTQQGDTNAGILALGIAFCIIAICLFGIGRIIRKMLVETPVEVIARITNVNNYFSMLSGCLSTVAIGSSSVTESILSPFLASGIFEIEQILPWSLGTNVGMAILTILQSTYSGNKDFFHVAIANLFFNVFSIALWYPHPFMRKFSLHSSLILGVITRKWRITPLIHYLFSFIGFPFMILGIMDMLANKNKALMILGIFILVILGLMIVPSLVWWFLGSGREKFISYFEEVEEEKANKDDNLSFPDTATEGSSIAGGSSYGGFEVSYNERNRSRETSHPRGILRNKSEKRHDHRRSSTNANGRSNPMKQRSRKRTKRARSRQPVNKKQCCTDMNACGIGA